MPEPSRHSRLPDEIARWRDVIVEHAAEGFLVIGVNAEENAEQVTPFLEKMELTFPIWIDAKKDVYKAFNSSHLPSSFVIDRTGVVRLAWYGPVSLEVMETFVTPLLQE